MYHLVGVVENGGKHACVGPAGIGEISVSYAQFCCGPKAALSTKSGNQSEPCPGGGRSGQGHGKGRQAEERACTPDTVHSIWCNFQPAQLWLCNGSFRVPGMISFN